MSDYMPPEVLVEILLRLPAKPLVRFGCVSKSWYSMISSPDFISMYTNFTSTNLRHSNSTQLFMRHYSRTLGKEIFFMQADDLYGGCQRFDCPVKNRSGGYLEIVGSCYGLVCLIDTSYQRGIQQSMPRPIIVWNPSAEKTMVLPSKQVAENGNGEQLLGFGFDFKTNDFKVVSVQGVKRVQKNDFKVVGEVDIFALSEGSWRRITVTVPPPCSLIKYPPSQVYVSGNIYWVGHYGPDDVAAGMGGKTVVVVFDLGDGVFCELEMPSEVADGDSTDSLSIVKLRNSVCLVQYFKEDQHRQSYDVCCIWVMHKYGMAESWTKDYTICLPGGVGKMLGFWRKNEILLVTSCGELVSFDPENQKIDRLGIYGLPCSFHVDAYMESLVFTKHWFQLLPKLSSSTSAILGRKNVYSYDKNHRAKRAKNGPWLIG